MITILMSTYNGARYIREQLDSILAQRFTDWRLVVRDDGSTDETVEIVQSYAEKDGRIRIVCDGHNLKAMHSFEKLLMDYARDGYIAFADQDDVWLPDKLQVCMEKMQEVEKQYGADVPILIHTDLRIVDERLNLISPSFWQYSNVHPQILNNNTYYLAHCNSMTGCTMLFNQAARRVALPFSPKAIMHDYAVAMSVHLAHGRLVSIAQPTILYRQHGDNTIGALHYTFWRTLSIRWREAKEHYRAFSPEIFHSKLHFLYWKTRYFLRLHRHLR